MKSLLKWKIWRIESSIERLVLDQGFEPKVWSFGAYYIDPKYLVFVVGVTTDEAKETLKQSDNFNASMRALLGTFNWPKQARENVVFSIESQETVDRDSNGNWWYHYK